MPKKVSLKVIPPFVLVNGYFISLIIYSFYYNDVIYDRPTYMHTFENESYHWWPVLARTWFHFPKFYNLSFASVLAIHHLIFYCGFLLSFSALAKSKHRENIWPFVICIILLTDNFMLVHLRGGLSFMCVTCATVYMVVGRTWTAFLFSIFSILFHAGSFGFVLVLVLVNLFALFKVSHISRMSASFVVLGSLFLSALAIDLMRFLSYFLPAHAKIGSWTLQIARQQSEGVPLASIVISVILVISGIMLIRSRNVSIFFILLLVATAVLFLIGNFSGSFMLRGIKHNYLFPLLFILSSTFTFNWASLRLYWKKTI